MPGSIRPARTLPAAARGCDRLSRVEVLARRHAPGARDVARARVDRIRAAGEAPAVASVDQHVVGGGDLVDLGEPVAAARAPA